MTLREQWQSFALEILPLDCSDIQRRETKRAFFAGAWGMFHLVSSVGEDTPDEDALAMLDGWKREMEEFQEKVRQGRA